MPLHGSGEHAEPGECMTVPRDRDRRDTVALGPSRPACDLEVDGLAESDGSLPSHWAKNRTDGVHERCPTP